LTEPRDEDRIKLYEEACKNSPEAVDRSAAEARLTILKAKGY
jgi:hypothetical protein